MLSLVKVATLVAATLTMGIMAGVFLLYAHTIMPGLAKTDDRTFVGAFQAIDRAIINPWFMPMFFGALIFSGAAALLVRGRASFPWIAIAFVLYLFTFIVTIRVNVPLNDTIKSAGDPARIDVVEARRAFDEAKWSRWNVARAVTTTVAFACLVWALVEQGREGE